jgi:hypothetical protein
MTSPVSGFFQQLELELEEKAGNNICSLLVNTDHHPRVFGPSL